MTGLNHALTGAAIALAIRQPIIAPIVAFLSHFVLDVLPHFGGTPAYHYGHRWFGYIMGADAFITGVAVLTICLIAPHYAILIMLCVLCAVLPDILLFHYYTHNRPNTWFHRWHLKIQWFERPSGALVEASYAIFISIIIMAML